MNLNYDLATPEKREHFNSLSRDREKAFMAATAVILNRFIRFAMLCSVVSSGYFFVTSAAASSQNCSSQFDCSVHESCCNSVCVFGDTCLGYSCSDDSNCKLWESCCYEICSEHCIPHYNIFVDASIAASILGSCILLCLASLCFYFYRYRCRRPYQRRVVVGQPLAVKAKTITTKCSTQNNTPVMAEALPEYPPHYVEYMQYNAAVRTKEGEPPPQYESLLHAVQNPPSIYL